MRWLNFLNTRGVALVTISVTLSQNHSRTHLGHLPAPARQNPRRSAAGRGRDGVCRGLPDARDGRRARQLYLHAANYTAMSVELSRAIYFGGEMGESWHGDAWRGRISEKSQLNFNFLSPLPSTLAAMNVSTADNTRSPRRYRYHARRYRCPIEEKMTRARLL